MRPKETASPEDDQRIPTSILVAPYFWLYHSHMIDLADLRKQPDAYQDAAKKKCIAIVYYRKALEQGTDDAEAWMDLGAAYGRNNQPMEALQAWQSALAMLNPRKGRDKENIQSILENVRTVQKGLKNAGMEEE